MFRRGAEDQSSDMPALPSESVGLFVIQALTPSMEKLVLAAFVNGAFNTTVTNRAISVRSVSSTVATSVDHDEAIHLLYDMVRTKSVQKVVEVMEAITRLLIDHPTASASTTEPLMLEQYGIQVLASDLRMTSVNHVEQFLKDYANRVFHARLVGIRADNPTAVSTTSFLPGNSVISADDRNPAPGPASAFFSTPCSLPVSAHKSVNFAPPPSVATKRPTDPPSAGEQPRRKYARTPGDSGPCQECNSIIHVQGSTRPFFCWHSLGKGRVEKVARLRIDVDGTSARESEKQASLRIWPDVRTKYTTGGK